MMDEELDGLLCDLLELPPGERIAALDAMDHLPPASMNELRQMLAVAARADVYFDDVSDAANQLATPSPTDNAGDACGPYRLVRKIGEGGFGVVWLAEQERPIRRSVAVKVIKAGMDTAEVLARFDAEKHALARMDHPHIARVLDAGVTDHGRPYFVMELVEGPSITRYCEEKALGIQERLALFSDVCSAISHAHQKGIIHRDIKPSNVIITEIDSKPVVKVIDFGIAKAIEGPLTDHTLHTIAGQWIGTPAYMSPEQAGMGAGDVDTRSDIYTLGVLLYELLTGAAPFDSPTLLKAGYEEMRRIIREVEPPRPSHRIATAIRETTAKGGSRGSGTTKSALKTVSSELDWIVMKAMEKVRERRYESAAAFADDVLRYLSNQPVEARPPGNAYLMAKFARRHRAPMLVGAAFLALLMAAVVFSSVQAVRASRAAEEARNAQYLAQSRLQEAETARMAKDAALDDSQAVTRLLSEVFRRPDPEVDGRKVTVAEALDAAAAKLDQELQSQPERHAMLLEVLAETYENLGIMDRAIKLRRKVPALLKKNGDTSSNRYLDALEILISRLGHIGEYAEARELGVEELALRKNLHGLEDERTLSTLEALALNTFRTGRYVEAIDLQIQLVKSLSEILPEQDERLRRAITEVVNFARNSGETARIRAFQREFASSRPPVNLGAARLAMDRQALVTKLEAAQETAERLEKELGLIHHQTIAARSNLADLLQQVGRGHEAVDLRVMIVQEAIELFGETHPRTLAAIEACRDVANSVQRWNQAYDMRRKATRIRDGTFGVERAAALRFYMERLLGDSIILRLEGGIELAEAHIDEIGTALGPKSYHFLECLWHYARILSSFGRSHEAIEVLEVIYPDMLFNSLVHNIYGGLLLWNHREEEYEALRALIIDSFHSRRERYATRIGDLEYIIITSTMRPLECAMQSEKIRELIGFCEERIATRQDPDLIDAIGIRSGTVLGIGHHRLGNHHLALMRFDAVESELERLGGQDDPDSWYHQMRLIYRPLILHALGEEELARAMFAAHLPSIRFWIDDEEPLRDHNSVTGIWLTAFLALREALEIFDFEMPEFSGEHFDIIE